MKLDKAKIENIDKLIEASQPDTNKPMPVIDGIIDFQKYSKQKIKILWILKEANDLHQDGVIYGGYDMRKSLRKIKISTNTGWRNTFNPIIYSSYGILNNYTLWDDMGNTYKNQEIIDVLKKIAFINVKKIPGHSNSNMEEIQENYEKQKKIVLEQIDSYDPDVIIGGNTMSLLVDDLDLLLIEKYPVNYAIKDEKLYIDAYHPNNRVKGLTQEKYCDSIINCVKEWKMKN